MAKLQTFSPDAVTVVVANEDMTHILTNFGEGSVVTLEPAADRYTAVIGAKGEEYRGKTPNKSWNMTVNLSQTSHSNDVLQALSDIDFDQDAPFECTVRDTSGTSYWVTDEAYISQEPSAANTGGGTVESREWTIRLIEPDYNVGGNGRFTVDEINSIQNLGGTVDPRWT